MAPSKTPNEIADALYELALGGRDLAEVSQDDLRTLALDSAALGAVRALEEHRCDDQAERAYRRALAAESERDALAAVIEAVKALPRNTIPAQDDGHLYFVDGYLLDEALAQVPDSADRIEGGSQ